MKLLPLLATHLCIKELSYRSLLRRMQFMLPVHSLDRAMPIVGFLCCVTNSGYRVFVKLVWYMVLLEVKFQITLTKYYLSPVVIYRDLAR